jgi:hypothetical protein
MMQGYDDNGQPAIIAADMPEEGTNDANATHELLPAPAASGPGDDTGGTPPATPAPPVDHFAALAAVVPSQTLDNTVARVVSSGGVAGVTFEPSGGMSAEQFTTHAEGIQASLQADADAHVTASGINPATFYAWMHSRGADLVRSTALMLFHSRNPAMAMDAAIAEFRRSPQGRAR